MQRKPGKIDGFSLNPIRGKKGLDKSKGPKR